jgi:hypothetical protein
VILNDSCAVAQQVPKEHCRVQRLKAPVAEQQKQIDALAATVQKVSDRLELNEPPMQMVQRIGKFVGTSSNLTNC